MIRLMLRQKALWIPRACKSVMDALNNEFAGIVAEKYYKAVKEAVMKVDDKLFIWGLDCMELLNIWRE